MATAPPIRTTTRNEASMIWLEGQGRSHQKPLGRPDGGHCAFWGRPYRATLSGLVGCRAHRAARRARFAPMKTR